MIKIVVDLRVRGVEVERQQDQAWDASRRHSLVLLRPEDKKIAEFLRLLRDNPGKKVFVHCQTGDDRTGMMIALAEQGWTAEKAMKEMKAYGFSSSHHLRCPGLASYETKFPERFRTSPAFESLRRSQLLS